MKVCHKVTVWGPSSSSILKNVLSSSASSSESSSSSAQAYHNDKEIEGKSGRWNGSGSRIPWPR